MKKDILIVRLKIFGSKKQLYNAYAGAVAKRPSTSLFSYCRGSVIAPSYRAGEPRPYIWSTYNTLRLPPALENALYLVIFQAAPENHSFREKAFLVLSTFKIVYFATGSCCMPVLE